MMLKIFQKNIKCQNLLKSHQKKSFSSLTVFRPGFVVSKIQEMMRSRSGLYRLLVVCSAVHILGTLAGSLFIDRKLMLAIQDFIENDNLKENEMFQIFGVLKVGSIQIKKGSLETKFQITDFKNDLDIYYNGKYLYNINLINQTLFNYLQTLMQGIARFEFKEGETIVLTGYLPDITDKSKIICIEYMTKHSMEVNNWQDKSNAKRQTFGLNC